MVGRKFRAKRKRQAESSEGAKEQAEALEKSQRQAAEPEAVLKDKEEEFEDERKVHGWRVVELKKWVAELVGRVKRQGEEFSAERKQLEGRIAELEKKRAEGKSRKASMNGG
ncbi:hypothetical protein NEAUS04_2523 [Nematocida ausubeli]|uniref:uncharacterized protein n=1 Tax=Nematocida major TaxID=1912982 RepID=UPI0020078C9D|nr:uncharacterized protein NEMAJ01_2334 [Nematocida major]KAH9387438.1 hypothetical protein NEMAJ01_2334 [Nematocida major]KAI5159230.1 hypothetical protein NEPAR05_2451 [Nematocida parisii]KAI5165897.1 hypothetical protein NEAUS04_2523 [Nematocida ausubeli]